ncbi:UNVERIFIED_CONTAM: Dual specificity protein phosphatase 5 [Siphonaria sp. JEL0065]|nr:Dual specificity protein phosphatase 5 [Siphonaria sp. JEL0065]
MSQFSRFAEFKNQQYILQRRDLRPTPPSLITNIEGGNWLYLGDAYHAANKQLLQELGITRILNAAEGEIYNFHSDDAEFEYSKFEFVEGQSCVQDVPSYPLDQHFPQAVEFLARARQDNAKVLVHCAMGVSRSTSMILAYLTPLFVKQSRSVINPNAGFMGRLLAFEQQLAVESKLNHPTPRFDTVDKLCTFLENAGPSVKLVRWFDYKTQFEEIPGDPKQQLVELFQNQLQPVVVRADPVVVEEEDNGTMGSENLTLKPGRLPPPPPYLKNDSFVGFLTGNLYRVGSLGLSDLEEMAVVQKSLAESKIKTKLLKKFYTQLKAEMRLLLDENTDLARIVEEFSD